MVNDKNDEIEERKALGARHLAALRAAGELPGEVSAECHPEAEPGYGSVVVRVGDALVVGRYCITGWPRRRVQVYPYWTVTWTAGKMEVYAAHCLADALVIAGLLCSRRES